MRAHKAGDQKHERDDLWKKHQTERHALERATTSRIATVQTNVKEHFKPAWRGLYRNQATEKRYLKTAATHPFERACYVFANRERLAPEGKRMTLRDMASLILSPKRLMKRVEGVHEKERRTLGREQKSQQ